MKRATEQALTGEQGIALIAARVADMGHLWHPTSGADSGIDGQIELRDPGTDEVRNFRIGVQSKATTRTWPSETEQGFVFRARPADVDYWLGSNQPVILVCTRPSTGEAYWRDVHQWAESSPERRAACVFDFDKKRDVFDRTSATRFFVLRGKERLELDPPRPMRSPEQLKSNLLPVRWDTPVIWSVECPDTSAGELFQRSHEAGVPRTDVTERGGEIWSLSAFAPVYLEAIQASGNATSHAVNAFADAEDPDRRNLVAELIRRSVVAQHRRQLRWHGPERVAYFRLHGDGKSRKVKWGQGSGRTVVLPRKSTKHEGLSGYRHDAARLVPRRFGRKWFLAVRPTYLFTHDGKKRSSFHHQAVKKMKALDRVSAVSQQLRMWEWLLTRPPQLAEADDISPIHLGHLESVEIDVRPPEAAWKAAPADTKEIDDDIDDDADQLQLERWDEAA